MSDNLQGILLFIVVYGVMTLIPSTIMSIRHWKSGDRRKAILTLIGGILIPFIGLFCWALIIESAIEKWKNERFVKVIVPRTHRMHFPKVCVHCLKPSEETLQLENSISNTRQTSLRTTTTTTTTSMIDGVPYCHECALLSDKLKKYLRRLNWGSVLVFFVLFIIMIAIGGDNDIGAIETFLPIAVVIVIQMVIRIVLRIQNPDVKRIRGGKNRHLGISMKFTDEKAPSQGVILIFDNVTYGQKFATSNNLPIATAQQK